MLVEIVSIGLLELGISSGGRAGISKIKAQQSG